MAISQKFGGNWTEEKLNIFTSYLDAYIIALQNQKFKKIYIDAFAGTGEIETSDGGQYLVGSAKRALASEKKFDHYYFIEADSQKAGELQNMINTEFPQMRRIVTIYCGDANDKLAEIISSVDACLEILDGGKNFTRKIPRCHFLICSQKRDKAMVKG